jgi:hypothetical protein
MKTLRIISVILLFLNGISAVFGGYILMSDPTGNKIQMPLSYISNSPFKDYLIPGIILFIFNGISSQAIAITVIFGYKKSYLLIIAQGIILSAWIITQLFITTNSFILQPICLSIGIILIILGYLQRPETT